MGVEKSISRLDAIEKVTGSAKYVEDIIPANALVAKVLHSTIANGLVKEIDVSKAKALPGVEKILTCFDVPKIRFATVAHPLSLDPEHQEIYDHLMLTDRIRYYGDDIAVVVASDELTAKKALSLIDVTYEEYPPLLSVEAAYNDSGVPIHQEYPEHNILKSFSYHVQNNTLQSTDEAEVSRLKDELFKDLAVTKGTYKLPMIQHAHIENTCCFAYMEGKRIVVVTATQAPHVLRHIIADAIDYPLGDIRVIKPYVGGGFGNKQEALYEPLAAYLTRLLGGRCVTFVLSREETFINSRTRHQMEIRMVTGVSADGGSLGRCVSIDSNKGSYGSHGHAVPGHAVTNAAHLYPGEFTLGESRSIFTNLPSSAAMRGYGIPQVTFAMESQMDEMAALLKIDPIEFRKKHMMQLGFVDPFDPVTTKSNGLEQCIAKGMELIGWDEKRKNYPAQNSGNLRRGVGMAIFCYKSCVFPILLETAACRIVLNQNGSIQVQVGATEIGQGSDTIFAQMASEILTIPETKIHVLSTQDTDVTPYDPGAYASRQSYVGGGAVKKAALILKSKIISKAAEMLSVCADDLDLSGERVVMKDSGETRLTIAEVSSYTLYNTVLSEHLTAEATHTCKDNAFSFGACFTDIEVDIPVGAIKINKIISVHDSGRILNPKLALGQVHGGVAMAVGNALTEQMLFDSKTGKPLNNNFLDYKIPTAMDVPPIEAVLLDGFEPSGPFGNKGLGEPPIIPPAPAIRNALLHATGVCINELPMTPQRLVEQFIKHGLIKGQV